MIVVAAVFPNLYGRGVRGAFREKFVLRRGSWSRVEGSPAMALDACTVELK
jgi:hypothetical protein